MTVDRKNSLIQFVEAATAGVGLQLAATTEGQDYLARPTLAFTLQLANGTRSLTLELSHDFDHARADLLPALRAHLAAEASRLRSARPDCMVTLGGIPLSYNNFQWPCHTSSSGADTHIVHGEIRLADGSDTPLHAKIAASITLTFAEIVPAMEQPYAEDFVYNAVRKTLDLGQLELLKSGNRQPVPVTTRYFSRWGKKFVFTETTPAERTSYLLTKVYWLSAILGQNQPVWIADPRDAEYLNTTPAELLAAAQAAGSLLSLEGEFAVATPALTASGDNYRARLDEALRFTKPIFNESMRSGQANM